MTYHGAYQEFLVKVAAAADTAVWRTPRHQTYGRDLPSETVAEYRRQDAIKVGSNVIALLRESGIEVTERTC